MNNNILLNHSPRIPGMGHKSGPSEVDSKEGDWGSVHDTLIQRRPASDWLRRRTNGDSEYGEWYALRECTSLGYGYVL